MFKVYVWVLEKNTYLIGSHKFRTHVETDVGQLRQAKDGRTLHGLLAHWTTCIAHDSMNMHPGDLRSIEEQRGADSAQKEETSLIDYDCLNLCPLLGYVFCAVLPSLEHVNVNELGANLAVVPLTRLCAPIVNTKNPVAGS